MGLKLVEQIHALTTQGAQRAVPTDRIHAPNAQRHAEVDVEGKIHHPAKVRATAERDRVELGDREHEVLADHELGREVGPGPGPCDPGGELEAVTQGLDLPVAGVRVDVLEADTEAQVVTERPSVAELDARELAQRDRANRGVVGRARIELGEAIDRRAGLDAAREQREQEAQA